MKLTTKKTVQKIRTLADYRRKEANPMFTSILKAAFEYDGRLTVELAQTQLSGFALNRRMWENILNRLTMQKYFEKNGIHYILFAKRGEGWTHH